MTINPLVAARLDGPTKPWTGIWLAEDIELLAQGVADGSWIEGGLGALAAGMDTRMLLGDPVGTLLAWNVSWLVEHVKPLTEALDKLTGDQGQVAAYAQTWRNVAASLRQGATDLATAHRTEATAWEGAGAAAYRAWASGQRTGLDGLATAADTMALITEGAGALVGVVRAVVRDLISMLVAQLVKYAALELITVAGATPIVAAQVSNLIAACAAKISTLIRALLNSMRNLGQIIQRLGALVTRLKELFGRLRGGPTTGPRPPRRLPRDQIPARLTGNRVPANLRRGSFYDNEFSLDPAVRRWCSPRSVRNLSHRSEEFRLFVDAEGRLRSALDGTLFDTARAPRSPVIDRPVAIFVMDESGNLYATKAWAIMKVHHSSLLGGVPVAGAGEIEVRAGRLIAMSDSSGHYRPTVTHNDRVLQELRRQGLQPDPTLRLLGLDGYPR